MATRADSRTAAGHAPSPADHRPFGIMDELNCYFDSSAEPNNVHVEIWLPGHLDLDRLRERGHGHAGRPAASRGSARRPRLVAPRLCLGVPATGRRRPGIDRVLADRGGSGRGPGALPGDRSPAGPLTAFPAAARPRPRAGQPDPQRPSCGVRRAVVPAAAAPDRGSVRRRAASRAGSRGSVPPSSLRRAPAASPAAPSPAAPGPAAPGNAAAGNAAAGNVRGTRPPGTRPPVRRTTRIAPRHGGDRRPRRAPGYGFALLGWPGVPAAPQSGNEPRVTVNDLLIAALIQAILRWNSSAHRRPGRVRISMPVDARPSGRGDELGNLSRLCTVAPRTRSAPPP